MRRMSVILGCCALWLFSCLFLAPEAQCARSAGEKTQSVSGKKQYKKQSARPDAQKKRKTPRRQAAEAATPEPPLKDPVLLRARSAILVDVGSGRVLFEQNADRPNAPASLTKIMSMCVIMDQLRNKRISLDDQVRIGSSSVRISGSRMGLARGDVVCVDKLLMGMAVSSGNDASLAMATHVGGSQKGFVRLMNAKAASLGMSSSSFRNPHGLFAEGHITTARDMATLARHYLRNYPEALRYHSTRTITYNDCQTKNGNPLLGSFEGADGLKTGWIGASGFNLIATARRGNTRLLGVVLGAPHSNARAVETHRLMEAGFMAAEGRVASVATALPRVPRTEYANVSSRMPGSGNNADKYVRKRRGYGVPVSAKHRAALRRSARNQAKIQENQRRQAARQFQRTSEARRPLSFRMEGNTLYIGRAPQWLLDSSHSTS